MRKHTKHQCGRRTRLEYPRRDDWLARSEELVDETEEEHSCADCEQCYCFSRVYLRFEFVAVMISEMRYRLTRGQARL